jgi:hypothetical protein
MVITAPERIETERCGGQLSSLSTLRFIVGSSRWAWTLHDSVFLVEQSLVARIWARTGVHHNLGSKYERELDERRATRREGSEL